MDIPLASWVGKTKPKDRQKIYSDIKYAIEVRAGNSQNCRIFPIYISGLQILSVELLMLNISYSLDLFVTKFA